MYNNHIILAGNPNVGKSTLFNRLTGQKVHTGNWSGKTVSQSQGFTIHNGKKYLVSDLPGISSLTSPTCEELSAFNAIISNNYNCCIIVADATNLSRSLILALRVLELTSKCILCINLCDEGNRKGITIDSAALSFILGIPVVKTSIKNKSSLSLLMDEAEKICETGPPQVRFTPLYPQNIENALAAFPFPREETISKIISSPSSYQTLSAKMAASVSSSAQKIARVTSYQKPIRRKIDPDKIVCSPYTGIPIMLALLSLVLYITITLSNYPSALLAYAFDIGEGYLYNFLSFIRISDFFKNIIIHGAYSATATIVSVMLPPMVIFFPLFALLEDLGYLPRVAFNLDNTFSKCGSCGKQALTICMGLGCNCVGIKNSAIIPSDRERLISILTNSFTPCNGRFAALIACTGIFLSRGSSCLTAIFMVVVLSFSFVSTLAASKLLSLTILKGKSDLFVLELPDYRKPPVFKTVVSSILENTPKILLRALKVSCPMGVAIYILNNLGFFTPLISLLRIPGALMGLDGVVLLSFILSFPANEMIFPIMLMLYTNSSVMSNISSVSSIGSILTANGWGVSTAVSFIILTLIHFPCSAALLTIKEETRSLKWTVVSIILPLLFGSSLCIIANYIFKLFHV